MHKKNIIKHLLLLFIANIFIGILLFPVFVKAEEPDTNIINKALVQYKGENAIYTINKQQLFIEFENNKLVAHTEDFKQKLLLTDLAPTLYGKEYLGYSFLNYLDNMPNAVAYVPNGNGYKRVRCTKFGGYRPSDEGIFYDDYRGLIVNFSGLTKGTVTETKYRLDFTEANLMPAFFLQSYLPTVNNVLEVSVPSFVKMRFVVRGEHSDLIQQTKEYKNNNIIYKFTANNISAYTNIKGVPSVQYYFPQVIPIVESYRLPGSPKTVKVLSDPDHLYKYYYKFIRNINVTEDSGINKVVAKITKNDITQREKATHIYDWVQKNIHYVGFEDSLGGFYPRQASLVCKRKFGDCKDMASILVAMCRKAGIKAYFTWIGTTLLPYNYEETPYPGADNHMICTINIDDDWIFLDGTHPNLPLGKTRDDIQGKEALIGIDENHSRIIKVPSATPEENLIIDHTDLKIISGKTVTGSIHNRYIGTDAYTIGEYMALFKEEDKRDKIVRFLTSRGNNKYEITNYKVETEKTGNREATITGNINIHDYLLDVKKHYVINMNLNRFFNDKWIDTTDRKVSYYLENKEKIVETVNLEIPKGSSVVYIPKAAHGKLHDLFSFNFTYKKNGNIITLTKEYTLNTLSIEQKDFRVFNKLIDYLQKQYKESVILTAK